MRKLATSVFTLAVAGCAALAATVTSAVAAPSSSTVTFTRSLAAAPASTGTANSGGSGRIFYLVYGNSRTLFGPDDDDMDEGVGSGAGVTAPDDSDPNIETPYDESDIQEAISSIPSDPEGQFRILLLAGLAGGAFSYDDALNSLELPFMFAGREQWVRNLEGVGVDTEPRLWDVTMQSVRSEDNARRLLLGRASALAERGLSSTDDLGYWQSLVPSWAPRVRDELARQGVPFSVELLADPDINISDPSKPLFSKNSAPLSLFQLGVLQDGENAFLRSLSAEELMLQVWPAYYRYFHRCAGCPVPDDLLAGMTLGSPVLLADGSYLRSPVAQTPAYRRWVRYGAPGESVSSDDDPKKALAAFQKLEASTILFTGDYSLFAPTQLSPDVITRYETLVQGG
jgi:hypothetical protein